MLKHVFIISLLLIRIQVALAQMPGFNQERWQKIIESAKPGEIRLTSHLYQLSLLAAVDSSEAWQRIQNSELRFDRSLHKVNVEIVYRNAENLKKITDRINTESLKKSGWDVKLSWRNRASVWVDPAVLIEKVKLLPEGYQAFEVLLPRHDDQGPSVMNSSTYIGSGLPGGTGIRVAILDGGYFDYQGAIDAGKAKMPVYVSKSGVPSTVDDLNIAGYTHGTSCAETFFDHAPNADYELYLNNNITEKGAAVDTCIAHGVKVISHSESEYNFGWDDDSGPACQLASTAAQNGILFFTSIGNRAQSHWEGSFADSDNNNVHEFATGTEYNALSSGIGNGGNTHCYLSWDAQPGSDYDIYIINTANGNILASSTNTGSSNFEYVNWVNTTGSSVVAGFRVVRKASASSSPNFEMFTHNAGNYTYAVAAGSNSSPSNTSHPNVISIAAVTYTIYNSAAGTAGLVPSYCSRGPTNSGRLCPIATGPTATTTRASGSSFNGTSCSAPNCAGMATAFWSANPYLDANGVRQILIRQAQLYKDWGTTGPDNIYGNGGMYLYSYAPNLRYMFRTDENITVTDSRRPYYSLAIAQKNAPDGSTVIILNNGNYPETGTFGTNGTGEGKSILYKSPFSQVTGNYGF